MDSGKLDLFKEQQSSFVNVGEPKANMILKILELMGEVKVSLAKLFQNLLN